MQRGEQAGAVFWVGLAAFVCAGAVKLRLGTPSEPGPGFLPFWTAAIMGVLALAHLVRVTLTGSCAGGEAVSAPRWPRAGVVAAAVLAYAVLMPRLGYLAATFLLMAVLFSLDGRRRWWAVAGWSLVVVLATYLVFHGCLKVQLPSGLMG